MSNSNDRINRRRFLKNTSLVAGSLLMNATSLRASEAHAESAGVTVTIDASTTYQTIDGFGTTAGSEAGKQWWQDLYYDDLNASILRVDMTPRLKSPYSDFTYNSPWFHNNPGFPGPGPYENVRTYTNPEDYSAEFNGKNTPIAVMGPDINQNIALFDFDEEQRPRPAGLAAAAGTARRKQLGDFKLLGTIWSPVPWVKKTSGTLAPDWYSLYLPYFFPRSGTPWPYIWADNFAGGKLDISGEPLDVFFDGVENTSSLTQFARSMAAYTLGFQRAYGVKFYALSVQNELGFEQFFNSMYYQNSAEFIPALLALRAEFDKHDELREIRLIGFEDLLGDNPYSLWEYGSSNGPIHKNLQFVKNIETDPAASAALDFFAIHGYAPDGISSGGSSPKLWDQWANGWDASPAGGIPSNVKGFTAFGKKSWMTETSGEGITWLGDSNGGFPSNGAWSIALKIHQALTTGRQSAWLYWQLADGDAGGVKGETLTDQNLTANSAKYIAFKHFAKYIRPKAQLIASQVAGSNTISASAYIHHRNKTLTAVLINGSANAQQVTVKLPKQPKDVKSLQVCTSSDGNLWQNSMLNVSSGTAEVTIPAYGVTTLYGKAE